MKSYKKYFSLHHWLAFLRRQPKHMQHVYALVFSAVVTSLIGAIILYYDYGFWRIRYVRSEVVTPKLDEDQMVTVQSPGAMIGDFLKEAGTRLQSIKTDSSKFIQGKEEYTQEMKATSTTSVASTSTTRSSEEKFMR